MSESQKKIWVTGASSGIGKAVAEKFAKEGWKVAVSARREEILNEMSKNENIFSFPLDVTNFDNCRSTFDKILRQFGNVDICFLCSGTYDPKKEQEINIRLEGLPPLKLNLLKQILKSEELNFIESDLIEKDEGLFGNLLVQYET